MLSSLWWLPLAVAAAAVVPMWRGARRLLDEAARLQASIAELAGVRPLVAEVTAAIADIRTQRSPMSPRSGRGIPDLGSR